MGEFVDMVEPAVQELRDRLRGVLKAVRLFKQHQTPVPPGMVSVLAAIAAIGDEHAAAGGCHLKDLAARNALDPSTVSRAVATLVRLGLVRRTADPTDGRASILELTEPGHIALRDTHAGYDALLAEALAGWSPAELALFGTLLQRFADDVQTRLARNTPAVPYQSSEPDPLHITLEAAR
ncbi:MarR family winged helix-turn-helix transcriptional regulator [Micromonosporaceae bacterium Da 78-11]